MNIETLLPYHSNKNYDSLKATGGIKLGKKTGCLRSISLLPYNSIQYEYEDTFLSTIAIKMVDSLSFSYEIKFSQRVYHEYVDMGSRRISKRVLTPVRGYSNGR
ncbi:hypothetical protein AVEN_109713-1 [Araneus ventricosus]|uniref:Uncharacterized protein n=1 Tax=Araneus ventricosus TaxID=182803 RepID=A0A4Y2JBS3_ARAVE|nr:hypothetical protein AVEN_109713-1 [Araneus ventricosus]